jgi:hypothetical protein
MCYVRPFCGRVRVGRVAQSFQFLSFGRSGPRRHKGAALCACASVSTCVRVNGRLQALRQQMDEEVSCCGWSRQTGLVVARQHMLCGREAEHAICQAGWGLWVYYSLASARVATRNQSQSPRL